MRYVCTIMEGQMAVRVRATVGKKEQTLHTELVPGNNKPELKENLKVAIPALVAARPTLSLIYADLQDLAYVKTLGDTTPKESE